MGPPAAAVVAVFGIPKGTNRQVEERKDSQIMGPPAAAVVAVALVAAGGTMMWATSTHPPKNNQGDQSDKEKRTTANSLRKPHPGSKRPPIWAVKKQNRKKEEQS
eukprot:CAMPEP_0180372174 /NCGR_PEP_ID=MMETSP0989-20121125/20334_1 /TAXON_ID=697907 /ORGANISM="non described non described, Strain CCMP2293" /LENGTH=104 /DNA_ID=CAMNT_0022368491 /DNA_START=134 /DNA_END=448 /DNA_ORIENTATION=-